MSDYILPEVWQNPTSMGGAWGGLNQPTAGARFEQTLPKVTNLSNSILFRHLMVSRQLSCLKN